ncbi:MAG: anti-sigma F factor [Ruminococcaceae bacterium]|nr:anti-sigma F factor [Oscillospiraceae bacterium]
MKENMMKLEFMAKSENEAFARSAVAAFVMGLDPTVEEMADIKTSVSEAVTNSIVHGYEGGEGRVYIECVISGKDIKIIVKDNGKGIKNVKEAMQPMFTTNTDNERSGMGFTVMQTFMDKVKVESILDVGTKVTMSKSIGAQTL